MLEGLQWSHDQFVDFCILMGTDYNSNPVKFGPVASYKYIDQLSSIEAILKVQEMGIDASLARYDFSPISNHPTVRKVFQESHLQEEGRVQLNQTDLDGFRRFMVGSKTIGAKRIDTVLERFQKIDLPGLLSSSGITDQ